MVTCSCVTVVSRLRCASLPSLSHLLCSPWHSWIFLHCELSSKVNQQTFKCKKKTQKQKKWKKLLERQEGGQSSTQIISNVATESCKSQSRKACLQPVHRSADTRFITVTDFLLLHLNSVKGQRGERRLMSDATNEPQTFRVADGDSAATRRRHRCCRLVLIAAEEPQHFLKAQKKKKSVSCPSADLSHDWRRRISQMTSGQSLKSQDGHGSIFHESVMSYS